MTKQSKTRSDRKWAGGLVGTAALVLMAGAGVAGLSGCDTVAQIPFSDRTFSSVEAGGITPTVETGGGQCDWQGDGAGVEGGNATLQAVFMDNSSDFNRPIKPGEDFDGMEGGVEIDIDDISISNGRVYAFPDVPCESNDDCPTGTTCAGFEGDTTNRCSVGSPVGARTPTPTYIGEDNELHAVATMVSQVGRWRGRYSTDFEGMYEFVDGGANISMSDSTLDDVAVDRDKRRLNALQSVGRTWENLHTYVTADGRDSLFTLFRFREATADTLSPIDSSDFWTDSADDISATIDGLQSQSVENGRSNVYRAMKRTIKTAFDHDDVAEADQRTLILLVAGYDEVKMSTAEKVIETAEEFDVQVTIVQVDPELQDPSALRMDWAYYEGEDQCSTDADCKNFETCAEPTPYTSIADTDNPDDIEYPSEAGTYCVPDYDENGRIGPIRDYATIACATGGAYHYIPSNDQTLMADPMNAQVWMPEGGWAIDFTMDELNEFDSQEDLLIEMSVGVNIIQSRTANFEPDTVRDRRRAIFTAD